MKSPPVLQVERSVPALAVPHILLHGLTPALPLLCVAVETLLGQIFAFRHESILGDNILAEIEGRESYCAADLESLLLNDVGDCDWDTRGVASHSPGLCEHLARHDPLARPALLVVRLVGVVVPAQSSNPPSQGRRNLHNTSVSTRLNPSLPRSSRDRSDPS